MIRQFKGLDIQSTQFYIGDPTCMEQKKFRVKHIKNIKFGKYNGYVESKEYVDAGFKYVGISIVHEDDEDQIKNPIKMARLYHHAQIDFMTQSGFVGFIYGVKPKEFRRLRRDFEECIMEKTFFQYFEGTYFCVPALFKGSRFYSANLVEDKYGRTVKIEINFLDK